MSDVRLLKLVFFDPFLFIMKHYKTMITRTYPNRTSGYFIALIFSYKKLESPSK